MPVLITTFGLLLLFSLIGVQEANSVKEEFFIDKIQTVNFDEMRLDMSANLEEKAKKLFSKSKKELDLTDKVSADHEDNEPTKTSKRTSFLHIGALFSKDSDEKKRLTSQALETLISNLYEKEDFYKDHRNFHPDIEKSFIDALCRGVDDTNRSYLKTADSLQMVKIDDDLLCDFRAHLLTRARHLRKGAKDRNFSDFALQEYVSLDDSSYIASLWLATPPVLFALFRDENLVSEIVDFRQECYKEIKKAKKEEVKAVKDACSKNLKNKYAPHLSFDSKLVDFEVSTTRPYIKKD